MVAAHALVGLYCESPLHAGTGQALGVVDLPIQREAHTGWPCVYGSGIKGALREHARERVPCGQLRAAFGPETANAADHAGAVTVSDARLLLLPVRSLTGIFRWVIAPEVLHRLQRDARRLGMGLDSASVPPEPGPDRAWVFVGQQPEDVFLEEYVLKAAVRPDLAPWIAILAKLMGEEEAEQRLKQRLVVVDNDLFSFLAQQATPVAAHVRILPETKTVAAGALWYEETLAPDTLLYTLLSAGPDRRPKEEKQKEGTGLEPQSLREVALAGLTADPYLQIGGNATVGMGWCRVAILRSEGGEA